MRLLYLDWPHLRFRLVAEALQRAAPAEPLPELVVVGGQPWEQGTVVDCSPPAARLGVRRGQPLGTAHKLLPEAHFVADDASAAAARFAAVLDALAAFTPSLEVEPNPADTGFGRCLLGIEGLHLLWGDELKLAGRLLATVEPLHRQQSCRCAGGGGRRCSQWPPTGGGGGRRRRRRGSLPRAAAHPPATGRRADA
jgi:hypothetical protein